MGFQRIASHMCIFPIFSPVVPSYSYLAKVLPLPTSPSTFIHSLIIYLSIFDNFPGFIRVACRVPGLVVIVGIWPPVVYTTEENAFRSSDTHS